MPGARPFVARIFASPAIKSWAEADGVALRKALIAALDAARGGQPLILDVMVEFEAENLEPKLAASKVLLWRSKRHTNLGARLRRSLGIYSGESTVAAAVEVPDGAALDALLPGSTLWDGELAIYPPPSRPLTELPDPHYEIAGFAAAAPWSINQDTGSGTWLITASGEAALDMVCATLARAFEREGLRSATLSAPPEVYG